MSDRLIFYKVKLTLSDGRVTVRQVAVKNKEHIPKLIEENKNFIVDPTRRRDEAGNLILDPATKKPEMATFSHISGIEGEKLGMAMMDEQYDEEIQRSEFVEEETQQYNVFNRILAKEGADVLEQYNKLVGQVYGQEGSIADSNALNPFVEKIFKDA